MGCRTGVLFITALYQSQSPPLLSFKSFFKWAIPDLFFFIFVFPTKLTANKCSFKNSPIPWFKPRTSGVGINCSANWAPGGGPRPLKVCSKSLFPIKVRGNFGKGNLDFYQNSLLGKLRWREEREIFEKTYAQCDLIGWFIGIWATFQSLWQQWFCPNLPHY